MSSSSNPSTHPNARVAGNDHATTLGEQTRKIADDVRELGSLAAAGASDALHSVKERGGQMLEGARDSAQSTLEQGKERVQKAREGFEGYVAENPFKAILIAAGVGALIGYSLRSRN